MERLYTILHREASNTNRIHLYNEDGKWYAYEKSACHLAGKFPGCRLEQIVDTETETILLRGVLNDYPVLTERHAPVRLITDSLTEGYVELENLPPLEEDIFNHWKRMMLKMKTLNYIVL